MDRRFNTRIKNPQVNAVIRNRTQRFEAIVTNISRGGLRFTSRDIFRKGERLSFELHLEQGEMTSILRLNARIVNVYEGDEDNHFTDYGVRFLFFGLFSKYSKHRTKDLR